jgi:predicted lipid-binding transport protein (Tim44 family)
MNNIPYIDILILAMIAIFIINRLKNVLGKKTGNEHDIVEKYSRGKANFEESPPDQISKSNQNQKIVNDVFFHNDPKINSDLRKIYNQDENFDSKEFLDGSKKAFEYIIKNYSEEKLEPLKNLLSSSIYKDFKSQIDARVKKSQNLDITIIGIKSAEIVNASLKSKIAVICVKFSSEQVQVIKDLEGKIVEGDNNQILSIDEKWSFSKNLKSKDPNWTLEKIEENN